MSENHASQTRVNDAEPITLETTRPVRRPVMLQGWYNLTSIHWQFDPAVVQRLLPKGFVVDEYDNSAWVGLIPFEMRRIRLPFGPNGGIAPGRFGSFPETNVRTYIIDRHGRRAVWFFSLDITRLAPTLIARAGYGLPYCTATMSITQRGESGDKEFAVSYESNRRWPRATSNMPARSAVDVRVGGRRTVRPNDLAAFLSARWALGSRFAGRLLWADVEHPEWELFDAELLRCDETMVVAAGLPEPTGTPVVLWSPGVEVRIGRPTLV